MLIIDKIDLSLEKSSSIGKNNLRQKNLNKNPRILN